jgi:hypothetical protein
MLPVDFPSPWKWGGGSKVRTDVLLQYPVLSGIMNEKEAGANGQKENRGTGQRARPSHL